jgi:serine/threonine protein kinase/tetratricopeptide (TPR) repeat protein
MTEETLFEQVLQIPVGDRVAFLDRECPDPALRARVEALLAADEASNSPIDGPVENARTVGDRATTGSDRPSLLAEREDTVIAGRYKLRQQIGEGGMGTVWMADQTEPIKRKVAVKLIRVERGQSKTILARFEAERQAIALMDHPHIARLLDAGTTETGSPFFVMELVKGIPLNEFCDQHKLTLHERLNLFTQICSAVQHAHQKGVIHRDLKPGNILVESHDGKPVPKVIDFGLAKATTGLQLSEQSLFTAFGSVMGTPLYMAPEQATFNAVDVDTRADVYALGVILYELLTGTTPLTKETMKKAALDEMLRLVREQEAPTPSSRLSSIDHAPSVAASRQIEPAKLGRFVKGELDWIVMKALAKERDRRYETANGFARDIERFLNHEPVTAGPPSARYRLQKFVRRNRPQVIAASLVLLALVAGIVGTASGLLEARRFAERERLAKVDADEKRIKAEHAVDAEKAAKEAEARAKREAQRNLAFATKGNEILGSVFAGLNPSKNYATVGEFSQALKDNLKKAVQDLDGSAIGDPLVVARMQNTLGLSLLRLGERTQAIQLLEKANGTLNDLLGADHPDTLAGASNLASGYQLAGMLDRALPMMEETLKRSKAKLGADDPRTLSDMNDLASCYRALGKTDLSLALLEESLKLSKAKLGPDHPDTLNSMNNLGSGYRAAGKLSLAVPLLEETLKLRRAKLGADHPNTVVTLGNLGAAYFSIGNLKLALPILEETLKLRRTKLGADHPETLISMSNLSTCYLTAGKTDQGLMLLQEAFTLMKAKFGPEHPDTMRCMQNLGTAYVHVGKLNEAVPVLEETLKLRKAKLGTDHPSTIESMVVLGKIYCETKQGPKAASVMIELTSAQRKLLPKNSPDYARMLANVSLELLSCDQFATAEEMLRECLAIRLKREPDVWTTFNTNSMLGGALLGQKKYADAEPLLLMGYEGMKAREKTIPLQGRTRIPEALDRLIELYTATNKPDEVKKYQELRAKYPTPKEAAPMANEKK